MGHYGRFIDEKLNYTSNITNGNVYASVIEKERQGDYLGKTVQVIPHITDEIKHKVYEAETSSGADIVITEIGGTIGDIESQTFIEALRQTQYELGRGNTFFVHTTLVPYIYGSGELKTKPTQKSVIELRSLGIQPDALVCRSPHHLEDGIREKLSLFCTVAKENVIEALDVANIYHIPLNFHEQKIDEIILKQFGLPVRKAVIGEWRRLVKTVDELDSEVEISLVGKYVELHDAYLSVAEALKHAGYKYKIGIKINWVDSERLEDGEVELEGTFANSVGIIVPGGFGYRGIEGKIRAITYARERDIPFLGICLGMQLAVIEFARNVCGLREASSREFDDICKEPVIDLMSEQKAVVNMGGTLRLGNYDCHLVKNTLAYKNYGIEKALERHRHRYELNNDYRDVLESNGMVFSGINEASNLVEIIEIPTLRYFIACQFHPEFKSRPTRPHPLFDSFVKASIDLKRTAVSSFLEYCK